MFKGRQRLLAGSVASLLVPPLLLGAAVLLLFRDRAWADEKLATMVLGAIGLGLTIGAVFAAPLFLRWLGWRKDVLEPPGPTDVQLAGWRSRLRDEIASTRAGSGESGGGRRSDLSQMLWSGRVVPLRGEEVFEDVEEDVARPRLQREKRTLQWSEITSEWDRERGRMVILGPAGYGKTVAALTLLKHIDTSREADPLLAELFRLSEWYRWQADHPEEPLHRWLADQLVETYPDMDGSVARALVDARLVPVLDGLDEVPDAHRRACKEAIDAYAGPVPPFRPFIVTCRPEEYAELAPDWVSPDRVVTLIGLEPDQVEAVLRTRTGKKRGWDEIRARVADGDSRLLELFESPLRLGIALHAYRDGDASALAMLDIESAEGLLWDQLLNLGSQTYRGA